MMSSVKNENSANNGAVTNAYKLALPTPESRKGTAKFLREITLGSDWLANLESQIHLLKDKPVELIFGRKDNMLGTVEVEEKWLKHFPDANVQVAPEANHFTQEDTPESFDKAIRNLLNEIPKSEVTTQAKSEARTQYAVN